MARSLPNKPVVWRWSYPVQPLTSRTAKRPLQGSDGVLGAEWSPLQAGREVLHILFWSRLHVLVRHR